MKNTRPGREQRVTPFFKEDLQQRDRQLNIPKRGTSASSYDDLFASPNKKEDSKKKASASSLVPSNRSNMSSLKKDIQLG